MLGDACVTQAGVAGNIRLGVAGSAIVKATLRVDAFPDPNVGFDDLTFRELLATPISKHSWGQVKNFYR